MFSNKFHIKTAAIVLIFGLLGNMYSSCGPVFMVIGPMHEEKNLGDAPKIPLASFLFSLLKVGIPLVKINIFQRFKYR